MQRVQAARVLVAGPGRGSWSRVLVRSIAVCFVSLSSMTPKKGGRRAAAAQDCSKLDESC